MTFGIDKIVCGCLWTSMWMFVGKKHGGVWRTETLYVMFHRCLSTLYLFFATIVCHDDCSIYHHDGWRSPFEFESLTWMARVICSREWLTWLAHVRDWRRCFCSVSLHVLHGILLVFTYFTWFTSESVQYTSSYTVQGWGLINYIDSSLYLLYWTHCTVHYTVHCMLLLILSINNVT